MEPTPDYRSDKMESREGRGLAQERRRQWEESIPADVWCLAFGGAGSRSLDALLGTERADAFRQQVSEEAKERSELIGFWVSWHLAGGFTGLEAAGWNRATLFRKVGQFRTVYGDHPDEHAFDFLKLEPNVCWRDELLELLGHDSSEKQ